MSVYNGDIPPQLDHHQSYTSSSQLLTLYVTPLAPSARSRVPIWRQGLVESPHPPPTDLQLLTPRLRILRPLYQFENCPPLVNTFTFKARYFRHQKTAPLTPIPTAYCPLLL
jgi:hypothetical protein